MLLSTRVRTPGVVQGKAAPGRVPRGVRDFFPGTRDTEWPRGAFTTERLAQRTA